MKDDKNIEQKETSKKDKKQKTSEMSFKRVVDATNPKEVEKLIQDLESAHERLQVFENKYKMQLAETENLRKRHAIELLDFTKYKSYDILSELLPWIDMFQTIILNENVSEEVKKWLVGFKMISRAIDEILKREKVEEINPKLGESFSHQLHQAVDNITSGKVKPGEIIELKKKGYKLHDKLIFPAMVTVETSKVDSDTKPIENTKNKVDDIVN